MPSPGNPRLTLRAPQERLDAWELLATASGMSLQGWIIAVCELAASKGAVFVVKEPGEPRQDGKKPGKSVKVAEPKPEPTPEPARKTKEPTEAPLERLARLRREWAELERDFPPLARSIGSFEQYEKQSA